MTDNQLALPTPVARADVSPPSSAPWPPARTANYTLFVLAVVAAFTVVDRQALALMIEPIKADFGLTDSQAALLVGPAFSLAYAIAVFPLSKIADRSNRRNLIAISLIVWSSATIACGMVQNYVQLILARLGVGIGEAGYSPTSTSIISDTFPRERVGYAISITYVGTQLGNALALLLGGASLAFIAHLPPLKLPLGATIRPWQGAFMIIGAPGLLWALSVMTLREPVRRGVSVVQRQRPPSIVAAIKYMIGDARAYGAILAGVCQGVFIAIGFTQWLPTLLHRSFHWELSKVGLIEGAVVLVAGPCGLLLGGKWSEVWARRGMPDTNLRIVLYGLLISVPLSILFPLLRNPYAVLAVFAASYLVSTMTAGPGIAAFQVITPNPIRAQVLAVALFMGSLLGFGLGPLIVALFTDYVFKNPQDLKYSMALCCAILGPIACLLTAQGLRPYARNYARLS